MESLPPVDLTGKSSAVLKDGIAQDPINLTCKNPTVLVDGIVQDPRQQREAKTNGHAPVTKKSVKLLRGKKCIKFKLKGCKKSKKLLRGNTLDMVILEEEAQRSVLENLKLKERISELRTLNSKVNDEITELLEQHSAYWKNWGNSYNQLADSVREMARSTGKISAVLEDGFAQDPKQQSEVSWFIYKVNNAETDGAVTDGAVTESLSRGNILYMVTVEERQQLTFENGKLNKRVIELLNLNAQAREKFSEHEKKKKGENGWSGRSNFLNFVRKELGCLKSLLNLLRKELGWLQSLMYEQSS